MIRGIACCPHPRVLVPQVAQGAAPELDELRAACRTAIARVRLPGRLLRDALGPNCGAGGYAVGPGGELPLGDTPDVALLVMGDGSADVWNAVGRAVGGRRWAAEVGYDAAPYGVGYFVASWTADG